jgi:hypothetical protein
MTFAVRSAGLVFGLGLLGSLAGCGGSLVPGSNIPVQPVKGTVTVGGRPVSGGRLSLTLVTNVDKYGPADVGVDIQPDGTFEPRQVGDKPGLVPGQWKVVINPTGYKDGKAYRIKQAIPAKYTRDDTTDLVINVQEGENTPTLAIK